VSAETTFLSDRRRLSVGEAMLHGSRIGGVNDDPEYGLPTWKDMYVKPRVVEPAAIFARRRSGAP
jgi:hypothetical protein